ncbi:hypothetical protein MF271_10430 [Deinococcus sp. KNUC1210]|uniref:hypothetical protein n=1 Tax=Deinococcus sp. KNUC1210 TaxID=2917691 RepID=UPI001EF065AC|nr:hypothetical protein [Deinococcus sp. KNUC1210]ULH14452.1 hypothetical protein MF271_10430 [Deinococcus sp. KNUC1210]
MHTFARVIALVGLVVIVVAAVILGKNIIDINQLHAVASANRSTNFFNPVYDIMWGTGLALVGGFVAGLGVALMTRRNEPTLRRPS